MPSLPGGDGHPRGYHLLCGREMHAFRSIGAPVLKQQGALDDKSRCDESAFYQRIGT